MSGAGFLPEFAQLQPVTTTLSGQAQETTNNQVQGVLTENGAGGALKMGRNKAFPVTQTLGPQS